MTRRLLASLVGTLVLFAWGFLGHVLVGLYDPAYGSFSDEAEVIAALERNAPAAGVYYVPAEPPRDGTPVAEAFVNFVPAGERSGFGPMIVRGLAINAVAVFVVLTLVSDARRQGYLQVASRFVLAGFAIGLVVHGYYWNWFDFPTTYFALSMVDSVIGWTLVGLAVAPLVRSGADAR